MADDQFTTQFSAHDSAQPEDDDTGEARTVEPDEVEEVDASHIVNGPADADDPRDDTADTDLPSFAPLAPAVRPDASAPRAVPASQSVPAVPSGQPADAQSPAIAPSTDAMPMPSPFPGTPHEHVETPQPVVSASPSATVAAAGVAAAGDAADADAGRETPGRRRARHASPMPEMPDLRSNAQGGPMDPVDAQSRNEFTTVYDILDRIEATLNEAKAGFFTPNVVKVDRDDLNGQLAELKRMLPVQLERASALMREAERRLEGAQTQANAIVTGAQSRAADMIKEANDQAQFLAGQENVVALAQAKARAIMDNAQARADRLTSGADKYCIDVMDSLDRQLDKLRQDVGAGLNVLHSRQQRAGQDYAAVRDSLDGDAQAPGAGTQRQ